ncbi:MAG: family 43 glycosylhydrolase [Planctomycetales bacterium]|nr:family 43 glycosylhydrolase [Planctomycetales bacterium]
MAPTRLRKGAGGQARSNASRSVGTLLASTSRAPGKSTGIRLVIAALLATSSCVVATRVKAQTSPPPVHDPVIIRQNDAYYVFSTGRGVSVWRSTDLANWTACDPVFSEPPDWIREMLPEFRNHFWAPDVYFRDGVYYLYYSVSEFGRNRSAIGVATNVTLNREDDDFQWIDRGKVVDSIPGRDMWNAIDSHVVQDDNDAPWMSFGSHWGGLKIVRLDANLTTLAEPQHWATIAARHRYWKIDERDAGDSANPELNYETLYPPQVLELNRSSESGAIEAPFIYRKHGYYYLFASWDRCCRGIESTYKVVVGRARQITGPYVDREGERMQHGGGSLVVQGVEASRWAALGHNAVAEFDGVDYLVCHGYDKRDRGRSKLIVEPITWDADLWPVVRVAADAPPDSR